MLAGRHTLRILDFGGGLGIGYMTLLESIPHAEERIEYTIVEVPQVGDAGRELFSGRVRYVETLPPGDRFDLVHTASALQYVEDWRRVLGSLAGYQADFMLLSDVFAGAIPSFVTLQNYYGSRIRHWFLNLEALVSACADVGYSVAMKSHVSARRLDIEDRLPMEQFPDTHRLEHTLHLLLARDRR